MNASFAATDSGAAGSADGSGLWRGRDRLGRIELPIAALAAALALSLGGCAPKPPPRLLLAPMIHGVDLCSPAGGAPPRTERELAAYCRHSGRSAATIVESSLAALGPPVSVDGRYEVGYTMPVPLLGLFMRDASGWTLDSRAVERLTATLRESPRPVILHLFSTHFGIGAPIEDHLAGDSSNLAVSPLGPMPKDRYFGIDIFPWTLASTDNDITRFRRLAIEGVLESVCRLPATDRARIRAVTLLGELHHFHADFEGGMGVAGPYVVSDYSAASVDGFRAFLRQRFGAIDALNREVGERFTSFDEVEPPGMPGGAARPGRHIDSAAHGRLPLAGWAFDTQRADSGPVWVRIYRNGAQIARVPAAFGRQDVLQAMPAIGTADVGWRFDMDFTGLAPGEYRLDFVAERSAGALASLGTRRIVVAGTSPNLPAPAAGQPPPLNNADGLQGSVDHPADSARVIYNPLAPLWHEFRGQQVVAYLGVFERLVRASCLAEVPLYAHQIAPFVNPGWDATKFAVDASLRQPGGLGLGISLYGEATYGTSFFDWLGTTTHRRYGVTEFHPLRAMSADELASTVERHRSQGAVFVSFFLDARPMESRDPALGNAFSFDPGNPLFGSDKLYEATRELLRR
jgi:hypothetical protein